MTEIAEKKYDLSIEDGILICQFKDESAIEQVLAAEADAIELLSSQEIYHIPAIVTIKNVDQAKTDLRLSNLSKIISSNKMFNYLSGLWIVGADKEVKKIIGILNAVFLGGRIHLVETFEEAKAAAEAHKTANRPMLEQ
jgi:hypothetical protein